MSGERRKRRSESGIENGDEIVLGSDTKRSEFRQEKAGKREARINANKKCKSKEKGCRTTC